ncbi:MAG TPA: hypothetical protein VMF65_19875 [Acidimicrobiales bacterium]|nr:hypothetical protein [Acidimicrobiales bacterium]
MSAWHWKTALVAEQDDVVTLRTHRHRPSRLARTCPARNRAARNRAARNRPARDLLASHAPARNRLEWQ